MKATSILGVAAVLLAAAPATAQNLDKVGLEALGQLESRYVQLNLGSGVGGESDASFRSPVIGGRIKSDLDAGLAVSGLVGAGFTSGLAFELEGVFLKNDVDTDDVEVATQSDFDVRTKIAGAFANVKYEYVNSTPLFPYVAAGLGYGQTDYRVFGDNGQSDGVLWQLKAGVAIPTTDSMTVDLGYRFLRSPSYESTDRITYNGQLYDAKFKAATEVHVLTAGVRYAF